MFSSGMRNSVRLDGRTSNHVNNNKVAMSCSSCYKKYGLFLRETGCGKCGFSFCTKCAKHVLPGLKRKVCLGCFNKANQPEEITQPQVAPRPETPQDPVPFRPETHKDPIQDAHPHDLELHQRLEELKKKGEDESSAQGFTDLDLKQRLAKLQDRQFVEDKPNRDIFRIDQRSEQEKVNDLVEQYHKEAALDEASDPIKDLEERLNKLRGIDGVPHRPSGSTPAGAGGVPEEEGDADKLFVKRILAEAMLDAQINYTDEEKELMEGIPKPPKNADDLEELPWCTICNENAKIRCMDCDGELYCKACFREIHHDDEDYRAHKTKVYQKPKKEDDLSSSDED